MNIYELRNWAINNNIDKKTIEAFKKELINFQTENPEEYQKKFLNITNNELSYQVHTISFNLEDWPSGKDQTISVSLWVFWGNKQKGISKFTYTLEGETKDKYIEFL